MSSKTAVISKSCRHYVLKRAPIEGTEEELRKAGEVLIKQWKEEKRSLYTANEKAKRQLNRERKKEGLGPLPKKMKK